MRANFEGTGRLLQQLLVFVVRHNGLAEVDGAVDDGLLLFSLQDPGDDRLGRDAVPAVINHHGAQCEKPLWIDARVRLHALQVIALCVFKCASYSPFATCFGIDQISHASGNRNHQVKLLTGAT